jgi:hypothetical protein
VYSRKIKVKQTLRKVKLIECVDKGVDGDECTVKEEDIEVA